jgi:hypothetical protein
MGLHGKRQVTFTLQCSSTSRLGLLRSRWMMGGLRECRYSMPVAASMAFKHGQRRVSTGQVQNSCMPANKLDAQLNSTPSLLALHPLPQQPHHCDAPRPCKLSCPCCAAFASTKYSGEGPTATELGDNGGRELAHAHECHDIGVAEGGHETGLGLQVGKQG